MILKLFFDNYYNYYYYLFSENQDTSFDDSSAFYSVELLDNIPETNFAVPGQAGEEYSNSLGTIKLLSDQNVKGKLQKFCHFVTTLIKYLLYISGDQLKFDETVLKEQSALINILPRANLSDTLSGNSSSTESSCDDSSSRSSCSSCSQKSSSFSEDNDDDILDKDYVLPKRNTSNFAVSSAVDDANDSSESSDEGKKIFFAKKRKIRPGLWKRSIAKRMRNSGKEYIS